MADIEKFILPHLVDIRSYEAAAPLEQMEEESGFGPEQIIRLNANENPYGASPKVAEALAKVKTHLYPDPLQRNLRRELAKYTGVGETHIIAGAGSDELIDMLFRLFVSPGDKVIDCGPTFGMYDFYSRIAGAVIKSVPRDDKFDIDLPGIEEAAAPDVKMIMLNSPNNPTGNPVSEAQIRSVLNTGLVVVVDEAYYEFCGETAAGLVKEYENLVVLRTFSKWAGIAGLRIGYGLMSPALANHLFAIKSAFNLNSAAEAAALASLEDAEMLLGNVRSIVSERESMVSTLAKMEGLKHYPSGGNYVLCEFAPGRAGEIFDGLSQRGIFVRRFSHPRLSDHLRITAGTPDQTKAVVGAMQELV